MKMPGRDIVNQYKVFPDAVAPQDGLLPFDFPQIYYLKNSSSTFNSGIKVAKDEQQNYLNNGWHRTCWLCSH